MLNEEERSWRDIVRRFVDAGRGLVAAHDAGLLHRDFKPDNVLVTADGAVKVTDFGLAEFAPSEEPSAEGLASSDDLTASGTIMGTPRYMAPEQHRGETLTAAADQYAFCVALLHALCGTPPFSGNTMTTMQAAKEAGPPKWPDSATPRPIVEVIVRGLAPAPQDRWPSMEALLHALAWDPSQRRNRTLLGLGTVAIASMGVVSYDAWAEARAKRCSGAHHKLAGTWDEARRQDIRSAVLGIGASYASDVWTQTEATLDGYAERWTAMHTEACAATTIRGEQSSAVMDLRMACLHRAQVELQAATDVLADADAEVVRNAHKLIGDLAPLDHCSDIESLQAGTIPPPADEAEAVEAARVLLAQVTALTKAGRYGQARVEVDRAAELLADVSYAPVNIELAQGQGDVHDKLGEYEEAEAAYTRALNAAARAGDVEGMQASATELLYVVGYQLRRMDEALMRYRTLALELRRDEGPAHATARNNLAIVLDAQGKHEEAEAEHRRALALREQALGPDHPSITQSRNNLSIVLYGQGKARTRRQKSRLGARWLYESKRSAPATLPLPNRATT